MNFGLTQNVLFPLNRKKYLVLERFLRFFKKRQYRFEFTYGLYVMEPWEKALCYLVLLEFLVLCALGLLNLSKRLYVKPVLFFVSNQHIKSLLPEMSIPKKYFRVTEQRVSPEL